MVHVLAQIRIGIALDQMVFIQMNIFFLFLHKNKCCGYSLEVLEVVCSNFA